MLLASTSSFDFGRTKSCTVIDKRVTSDYRKAIECLRADLRDDRKIDRFTISTVSEILTLRGRPPTPRDFFFVAGAVLQKYLTRHKIVLRLGTLYRRFSCVTRNDCWFEENVSTTNAWYIPGPINDSN